MQNKLTVTPEKPDAQILKFAQLIQGGIDAWTEAGKILVILIEKDSFCFAKIRASFPEISTDMLRVFERIGRKQIYAPLLADNSPAARHLLEMPYELQKKYFKEPIEVAVSWKNGVIKSAKKFLSELTKAEVKMVFGDGDIHSLDAQAWRLKDATSPPKKITAESKTVDIGYFSLSADKAGNVTIMPCGKSSLAQPVRVIPSKDGWKSAIIVFQRTA